MRAKRLTINCLLMLLVGIGGSSAAMTGAMGQTNMATAIYGRGVHAYFSGSTDDAIDHFESAIALGTRDPRVYYFRGLAFLRQGRQYAAEADFDQGAQLEYQGITTVNVGRALERIQGYQRMQLEKVRRQAHALLARQRAFETPRVPMVPAQPDGDPLRLRTPVRAGTDTVAPIDDAPVTDTDPFTDEGDMSVDAERAEPAVREEAPVDAIAPDDDARNPFEDDSPLDDPATAAEDSPFGADDEDSPFGADDEDSPFGASDEESPFGAGDASPADDVPTDSPTDADPMEDAGAPAEIDDPFGDDEDPFG